MAKGTSDTNATQQMFSADVVAAVLMASGTVSLSNKHYDIMSALDGNRTASSFQHAFRAVLTKAKDLKGRLEAGETFTPVSPTIKRGTPSSSKKRKNDGDDLDSTPTKKLAKPRAKKTPVIKEEPTNDFESSFPAEVDAFLGAEKMWEDQFV